MQCAAYSLSTDRLTPHPFNLRSNAGSTHTSISQTQPLDMTLSTCTQLLWSTMTRPVLSGTCPVKTAVWSWPPCCSSVSGSWQSSYSLHHLYVEQQFFFSLPWSAMLNFQWQVWERAIAPNLTHLCTFVASGLDINGCVMSYFEGTANVHCYKLYTHYFTL